MSLSQCKNLASGMPGVVKAKLFLALATYLKWDSGGFGLSENFAENDWGLVL